MPRDQFDAERTLRRLDFVEGFWPTTPDHFDFDPAAVQVTQVSIGVMKKIQPQMSKALWRPATGRKMGFLIHHDHILLGCIVLNQPIINLACRDEYLPGKPSMPCYGDCDLQLLSFEILLKGEPIGIPNSLSSKLLFRI